MEVQYGDPSSLLRLQRRHCQSSHQSMEVSMEIWRYSHHLQRKVWRCSMEWWEVLQPPLPRGAPHVSTIQQGLLVDPWLRMEIGRKIP